jgi:hypothetical protein
MGKRLIISPLTASAMSEGLVTTFPLRISLKVTSGIKHIALLCRYIVVKWISGAEAVGDDEIALPPVSLGQCKSNQLFIVHTMHVCLSCFVASGIMSRDRTVVEA